jgi:hypothetical protein
MGLQMARGPVRHVIELGIARHHFMKDVALDAHETGRRFRHFDEAVSGIE